jgi:uncharacterized membrane protein
MLLLALLIVPLLVIGWRAMTGTDIVRRITALGLRTALCAAIVIALAQPYRVQEHDHLTVIGLVDVSNSVRRFAQPAEASGAERRTILQQLHNWFQTAINTRRPGDRFGLIVFDGEALAVAVPDSTAAMDESLDIRGAEGTNIADAVLLGLAMFPSDTGRRIVLASDGNQTAGDMLEAARQAAGAVPIGDGAVRGGVPIDILPVEYAVRGDVQMVRVESPPRARPGQTVTVRIVLEATEPTTGRLTLLQEGNPLDLNTAAAGLDLPISLPAGTSVHRAEVTLLETPVNRFEAIFEPDDGAIDAVSDNNRAESFTSTPSRGKVLVLTRPDRTVDHPLQRILGNMDLPVEVVSPESLANDLLWLQSYDLIVLDNVASFELSPGQHELLARYVNDLGGGLIMIGGDNSFGAGGWNGTALERVLPLELDPPKELRLPSAALVLVLDKSGSMNQPVAGARATQQEVANEGAALAIESLRSESLVGVVAFDQTAHTYVPLQQNDDPDQIASRVRSIRADGGTNLEPALRRAYAMLKDVDVAKKRVVCLSDGRSSETNLDPLVRSMVNDGIKITTIAVGNDADRATLQRLSEIGEGEFYSVRNPRTLPRVLVDSVQIINKPLLKEGEFAPMVHRTGSSLTRGMLRAPPLGGLVVTAPRESSSATLELSHPDGEPLLAHWQAGLGRVAAYTSDLDGPWSKAWNDWPEAAAFWTQLARQIARPAMNPNSELITTIRDDQLHIVMEVSSGDGALLDYLNVDGVVYTPDGRTVSVRPQQTAPGRYEATTPALAAGNYIVALTPRQGEEQLAPAIGGATRSTSAEFRRYESNTRALEEVRRMTGGRTLTLADPSAANLYDREMFAPSVSALPAWRALMWLALAVLLLDIACRRLAWDSMLLRRTAAGAVTRATPARVKGDRAALTLATLRRADENLESAATPAPLATPAASTPRSMSDQIEPERPADEAPPQQSQASPEPRQPSAQEVAAAIDSLLGKQPRHEPESTQEAPEQKTPSSDDESPTETTSALLEAKRRARDKRNKKQ